VADGTSRSEAEALARALAAFPQTCLREDRLFLLEQVSMSESEALASELSHGMRSLTDGQGGLERFEPARGDTARSND
jgi:enoyl-CoA hydratase